MDNSCISCGSPLPEDQGSSICSMCYGDPYYGKDGYYLSWLEDAYNQQQEEARQEQEENQDDN